MKRTLFFKAKGFFSSFLGIRKMALFVVLFFSFFLLNAQNDTIEIADIENYLESYSISSNQKNLLTTPVVQGSLISPQNQIKISEELKNVDLAKIGFGKLISEKDSLRIAEEAKKECEYNPLFLDWIFRKDNPALEEEKTAENIINNLRREVYIDIKETSPELIAFHEEELPDINDLKLNFSERKTSVEDF